MKQLLLLYLFLTTISIFAQVGIGTTNPIADLHVNGSMLVQEEFKITPSLPVVNDTDENFKLVTRLTNSSPIGEVNILNVDSLNVAPINIVNYEFTNLEGDNMTDVNLQYDTSKYIVGVSNFQYIGDAVRKQTSASANSIGTFVIRTFEDDGTWHIEIRNRFLDITPGSIDYKVTLIVYDKSYFKNLPVIHTNLNGSNTGTASSIPDLN